MIVSSKTYKIIFFVSIVVIIFFSLFFSKGIRQRLNFSLRPGSFFINQGEKLHQFFNIFTNKYILAKENSVLRNENNRLIYKLSQLNIIKQENSDLRKALNLGLGQKFNLVLCRIEGKDIAQNSIFINKGEKDGLYTNLPVIDSNGVLFGWITKVYNNFSIVQLITNNKSSFSVEIIDQDSSSSPEVIAKGTGANNLALKFVPHDQKVSVGDNVISGYSNKTLPPGLLVGKVNTIQKIATSPFQKISVNPLFNIASAKNLFAITNY